MLPAGGLAQERYSDYLARFPSDQGAVVVFHNLLCSEAGWQLIQDVERELESLSIVERTFSLASSSSRYVRFTESSVELDTFRDVAFSDGLSRCEAARSYKPFRKLFVAENFDTALFLVTLSGSNAVEISQELGSVISKYQPLAADLGGGITLSGEPVMSAEVSRVIARDNAFVGVTLVLMLVALFAFTRSWATVVAAFALSVFVLAVAYGAMGWARITLTPATSLVVFLLVPLSTAFCIHAHGYFARLSQDELRKKPSTIPFVFAGVTTAVGFACTGLTPAPDLQQLALMGAIGVIAATAGIFLIVFPILSRWNDCRLSFRLIDLVRLLGRPAYGYAMLIGLLVGTVFGLADLQVNYGPTNYLPETNPARQDFDLVGRSFGRMNLPLMIEVENAESPEIWLQLKPLIDELSFRYPSGFQASWFYEHMSEVARGFTMGAEDGPLDFPSDEILMAQLMLLFDESDLELYLDEDRERVLIMFQIPFEGSAEYFQMKSHVETFLSENNISGYFVGRVSTFFETGHRVGADTLRGLFVGAVLIFLLLWYSLKSFPLAAVGIAINVLPVLAGVGSLGLLGIDLDLGSSIVAAVAFGIILDDSAHLIFRVKNLAESGYDPNTSVAMAIGDLSAPIVTTTGVICLGFGVLLFAEMVPFNDFASVILITLVSALATDLVILPLFVRRFLRDPLADS